mgnify:CR=1 FL=1
MLQKKINKRTEAQNNVSYKNGSKDKLSDGTIWTIKITIVTFVLSLLVSFITEILSSKSNVVVSLLMLTLLVVVSIIFDTIGVAATSCDIAPLHLAENNKVKGAEQAVKLVKNAEKVSNICADVIGDMCGIISGACSAAIVLMFAANNPNEYLFNIMTSGIVAAVTVGGKAFFKKIAIKKSKEVMLLAGRVLCFIKIKRKNET